MMVKLTIEIEEKEDGMLTTINTKKSDASHAEMAIAAAVEALVRVILGKDYNDR
jgi:hypothetical protein